MRKILITILMFILSSESNAGGCKVEFNISVNGTDTAKYPVYISLTRILNPLARQYIFIDTGSKAIELMPGKYALSILSGRYEDYSDTVRIPCDSTLKLSFCLKPKQPEKIEYYETGKTSPSLPLNNNRLNPELLAEAPKKDAGIIERVTIEGKIIECVYIISDHTEYYYPFLDWPDQIMYHETPFDPLKVMVPGVIMFDDNLFLNGYDDRLFVR